MKELRQASPKRNEKTTGLIQGPPTPHSLWTQRWTFHFSSIFFEFNCLATSGEINICVFREKWKKALWLRQLKKRFYPKKNKIKKKSKHHWVLLLFTDKMNQKVLPEIEKFILLNILKWFCVDNFIREFFFQFQLRTFCRLKTSRIAEISGVTQEFFV